MMDVNRIYQGDALSVLLTFPDNSVDMCMTSPPYYGLRNYGVEQVFPGGYKGQLGLEPTPEVYVWHLVEIFHEVKRVLKKEGTLWVVINDSYLNKCLCMIPEQLAMALVRDGWVLRNKNIWYKHGGMPSSAKEIGRASCRERV